MWKICHVIVLCDAHYIQYGSLVWQPLYHHSFQFKVGNNITPFVNVLCTYTIKWSEDNTFYINILSLPQVHKVLEKLCVMTYYYSLHVTSIMSVYILDHWHLFEKSILII